MNKIQLIILAAISLAPFRMMGTEDPTLEDCPRLTPGGFYRQMARQDFAFNAISTLLGIGDILHPEQPDDDSSLDDLDDSQDLVDPVVTPISAFLNPCRAELTGNPIVIIQDRLKTNYVLEILHDDAKGGRGSYYANGKQYFVTWDDNRNIIEHTHHKAFLKGETVPTRKKANRLPMLDAIGDTSPIVFMNKQGVATLRDGTISAQLMQVLRELNAIKLTKPDGKLLSEAIELEHLNATNIARLTSHIERLDKYMHKSIDLLTRRVLQSIVLISQMSQSCAYSIGRVSTLSNLDIDVHIPSHWM
ncbi:MAG: hypothetical protein LBJ89_02275 [Holosporales bacterium]|jgi:hypothetical protein|nr:hypothetical protein [Holosporales bacterium]